MWHIGHHISDIEISPMSQDSTYIKKFYVDLVQYTAHYTDISQSLLSERNAVISELCA